MPKVAGSTVGDFAETIYWVIRSRFEEDGSMTVYDVNQLLDDIAMKHAANESSNYIFKFHNIPTYQSICKLITTEQCICNFIIRKCRTNFTTNAFKIQC